MTCLFQVGEKWLPAVLGLLPDHKQETYRLQNEMIKLKMEDDCLEIRAKSLISDFEVGIITAAEETVPGLEIRGCLFHYRQVNCLYRAL